MSDDHDPGGLAERVRAARERAGLRREELAVHSGISWSAIAQVETGRRTNLRPATLAALARALGVTIDYLVSGHNPDGPMLEHRALFYDDVSKFVSGATTFLSPCIDRSEATLVVTSADKIDALRLGLADRAEHVQFGDHRDWYRSPGEALDGYRAFLKTAVAGGASWVTILGEPVWSGSSETQLRQWARYESLLNLVFSREPVSVLCPYDRARLDARIIETAYATHRDTVEHQALSPSPSYSDPGTYVLED